MKNLKVFCSKNKISMMYTAGILIFGLSAVLGVLFGSAQLSFQDIINAVKHGFDSSPEARIFGFVRLPRTVASLVCGGALAVSGAVIQNVLNNQLASPSVIGVNSGAGLAVTLCTAFGVYGGWQLPLFSFLGAFLTVMLVSFGAKKWGASRGTVILMGVALNSLLGAISDSVITFVPEVGVMSNDFKIGEFSAVTYSVLLPALFTVVVGFVLLLLLSNDLDVIQLGEGSAKSLGMNVKFTRTVLLMLAALLAGCAVSIAGLLSFVGLIVPHIVRRLSDGKSIHLIALSGLFGGGFVCLCDTLARTLFTPYEIPVGIIMAFLGAPFFIFLLLKGKGGHKNA